MGPVRYTFQDIAPYRAELLLIAQSLHRDLGLTPHECLRPEVILENSLQEVISGKYTHHPNVEPSLAVWLAGHLRRHVQDSWNTILKELHDQMLFQARYRWRVWGLPQGQIDPEDVVNGAWVRASRGRSGFTGKTASEYYVWLNTILENHARDEWDRLVKTKKRGGGRDRSLDESLQDVSGKLGDLVADANQSTPSSPIRREEECAKIRIEIERLPPELRDIIILKLQESSYDEIAQVLKVNKTQVRIRIAQAYGILRKRLQG